MQKIFSDRDPCPLEAFNFVRRIDQCFVRKYENKKSKSPAVCLMLTCSLSSALIFNKVYKLNIFNSLNIIWHVISGVGQKLYSVVI